MQKSLLILLRKKGKIVCTVKLNKNKLEVEGIIFVGIQPSGKSTFYHDRFSNTHLRINLDMLKTRLMALSRTGNFL